MTGDSIFGILILVGLGGVAIWFLTRPKEEPPCNVPVSAYGVGTAIPCGVLKETVGLAVQGGSSLVDNVVHPFGAGMEKRDENSLCADFTKAKDHGFQGCTGNGGYLDRLPGYKEFRLSPVGQAVNAVGNKVGSTSTAGFFGGK